MRGKAEIQDALLSEMESCEWVKKELIRVPDCESFSESLRISEARVRLLRWALKREDQYR